MRIPIDGSYIRLGEVGYGQTHVPEHVCLGMLEHILRAYTTEYSGEGTCHTCSRL